MKYLKNFNESISDNLIQSIKDILVDISDEASLHVEVGSNSDISICISGVDFMNLFQTNIPRFQFKDEWITNLEQLESYLELNSFEINKVDVLWSNEKFSFNTYNTGDYKENILGKKMCYIILKFKINFFK